METGVKVSGSPYPTRFLGIGKRTEFTPRNANYYLFSQYNLVWEISQEFRHQECRGRGCMSCLYQGITQKLLFPCFCQICHRPFEIRAHFILTDTSRYVNSLDGRILFLYQCPKCQSGKHARRAKMNGEEFYGYSD